MTQEEKELLFRDLCGRLPYGVILNCCNSIGEKLTSIDENGLVNQDYDIDEVKPYLFPLSSMTEEQKSFFDSKHIEIDDYLGIIAPFAHVECEEWDEVFCWLNKNHFDYHGLIPMELAKDATGLGIYD